MLPKQFQVSFDFKPTKWIGGWTSILHLTTGANCCGLGSRIPAIFPLNGKLAISFSVGNSGNYYIWTPKLALNRWFHVRVNQRLEGKNYVYRVYLNKKLLVTKVNNKPQDYRNVKVYVADNWYNVQPGFIKNIHITNGPVGHVGKSCLFISINFSEYMSHINPFHQID